MQLTGHTLSLETNMIPARALPNQLRLFHMLFITTLKHPWSHPGLSLRAIWDKAGYPWSRGQVSGFRVSGPTSTVAEVDSKDMGIARIAIVRRRNVSPHSGSYRCNIPVQSPLKPKPCSLPAQTRSAATPSWAEPVRLLPRKPM